MQFSRIDVYAQNQARKYPMGIFRTFAELGIISEQSKHTQTNNSRAEQSREREAYSAQCEFQKWTRVTTKTMPWAESTDG